MVSTRYTSAVPACPPAASPSASSAYVEKVVNPPSTPVPRNGRASGCTVSSSVTITMSSPMNAHPEAFTTSVAQGNAPAGVGQSSAMP